MNEEQKSLSACCECKSEYYEGTSRMAGLCPECANVLYGYPVCDHVFVDGRCRLCYWNGNRSRYIAMLLAKD